MLRPDIVQREALRIVPPEGQVRADGALRGFDSNPSDEQNCDWPMQTSEQEGAGSIPPLFLWSVVRNTTPKKEGGREENTYRQSEGMGTCCSSWWNLERGQGNGSNMECLSHCLLNDSSSSQEPGGERKLHTMEQKMSAMELRLNTIDEANQRLYNKWGTVEERFHQQEAQYQGDTRALMARCRALEQRIEALSVASFDTCDDIVVVE